MALTVGGYAALARILGQYQQLRGRTFDGAVVTGTSISGTLTFTPTAQRREQQLALSYSTLNSVAASLSTISGNYTSAAAFAGRHGSHGRRRRQHLLRRRDLRSSSSGCVMNGAITVGSAAMISIRSRTRSRAATGTYASLNAVPFSGTAVAQHHRHAQSAGHRCNRAGQRRHLLRTGQRADARLGPVETTGVVLRVPARPGP